MYDMNIEWSYNDYCMPNLPVDHSQWPESTNKAKNSQNIKYLGFLAKYHIGNEID